MMKMNSLIEENMMPILNRCNNCQGVREAAAEKDINVSSHEDALTHLYTTMGHSESSIDKGDKDTDTYMKEEYNGDFNNTTPPANNDYDMLVTTNDVNEYRRKLREEFTDTITLHGYRQVVNERGWRKLSWVLVMTILTSFAVYLFYHTLLDFGHKTVLEYEMQDGAMDLKYPTITICGNSPVYGERSHTNFPVNVTMEEFKTFYLEVLSSFSYKYNISRRSAEILAKLEALNLTSYEELIEIFEHNINDAMEADEWKSFLTGPACYFGEEPCNLNGDFKGTLHWKYSFCHQWNYYDALRGPKNQTRSDQTLTMLLNIHAEHKLISYYPFFGVVLYIHPYGTPHHLSAHTDSIGLQTGMFTIVDIELTEVNLLPSPYNTGCGSRELNIIREFPYSKALCEVDCVLTKIYNQCKCVGFEFKGQVGDVPICDVHQMKCYFQHLELYKASCVQYGSKCPRECTYYKYHFQRSLIMNLGDEIMLNGLRNRKQVGHENIMDTESYIRNNLLGFEIGYKSMSQLKENYKPAVSFSAVIGTVGGSIGLCLGFSFVTGYEIIFFIYSYLTAPWKLRRKKGKP